jgi:hypothetical protein
MKPQIFTVAAVALLASACQSSAESVAQREDEIARLVAARQGAEVDRICFTSSINGWSPLGRNALLLERGVNDWFKVDLTGTCDPEWAFNAIAISTRPAGSSCLTRGDRIHTDDRTIPGTCYVDKIYEWDETKEPAPAAPTSATTPSPTAG